VDQNRAVPEAELDEFVQCVRAARASLRRAHGLRPTKKRLNSGAVCSDPRSARKTQAAFGESCGQRIAADFDGKDRVNAGSRNRKAEFELNPDALAPNCISHASRDPEGQPNMTVSSLSCAGDHVEWQAGGSASRNRIRAPAPPRDHKKRCSSGGALRKPADPSVLLAGGTVARSTPRGGTPERPIHHRHVPGASFHSLRGVW